MNFAFFPPQATSTSKLHQTGAIRVNRRPSLSSRRHVCVTTRTFSFPSRTRSPWKMSHELNAVYHSMCRPDDDDDDGQGINRELLGHKNHPITKFI